jgi:hypothetical protein
MAEGTNAGAYAGAAATRISRGCLSSIGVRMFLIFTLAVMALLYYELAPSGLPARWGSDFHIFYAASILSRRLVETPARRAIRAALAQPHDQTELSTWKAAA